MALQQQSNTRLTYEMRSSGQASSKADDFEWPSRPDEANTDPTSEVPSKRRRVALACNVCRARKSRCDGIRPKCSLCIELGFDCRYQQSSSYSNVIIGKEYLSSIENRLKLVEGRILSLESNTSTGLPKHGLPVTPNGSASSEQLETASIRDESPENADVAEDSIDAMGAVTFGPEEDCAFFGPSSNIAFLRHISRAVSRLSHDSQPWRPSPAEQNSASFTGAFFNTSRPTSPAPTSLENSSEEVNIYALPPNSESRELLRRYFSNTGLLFPYIDEKSFMETFEQASKNNFKGVRRIWLALLNIMFAHAIVHIITRDTSPKGDGLNATGHGIESEMYYRRASGLCSEQIAKGIGTSIEFVQFLLLVAQYLQGTQKSVQVWKTHGLVVRAAFQLGLHSSDLSKMFDPIEQEVRRKTWFGCVIVDRTMSMTFGRPPSIPESYVLVDLPKPSLPIEEEPQKEGTKEILSIAFFNGTITLYRHLYTIIELLYGNNLACSFYSSAVDTVSHVYKIENHFAEWQSNLPSEMKLITTEDIAPHRLPPEEESSEEAWRQLRLRFILTLRYTNVRILLHRTVLVKYLEQQENPDDGQTISLLQQVGTLNIQIAIKSAKDLICLVHHAIKYSAGRSEWDLLGAWWFSLYYTFNAALILGACILIHIDHHSSGNQSKMQMPDTIEDMGLHLTMAIEALHDLDCNNRMVARCRSYLEQLVQVVQSIALSRGLMPQTNELRAGFSPMPPFGSMSDTRNFGLSSGSTMLPNTGLLNNKHSPLGMELGEFMLDGDYDFLNNHIFAFNRTPGP